MSSDYNYDTDAQFFPFFILTLGSIITIPLTYGLLRTPSDAASSRNAAQITSSYQPENADIIDSQRAKQKRKELRLKRMIVAAIGWLIMGYMAYLTIVTESTVPKVWNPYDILDISHSATEKEIHRKYRRLSVTLHPDKLKPDPAKNETIESLNNKYIDIVKAYKALTDEDVRNNYIQYGNPDGKQSTSFGIALPQFLIADGSRKYVLIFYGAMLAIVLPWLVGQWWWGMQKMTKEKILVTTAGNMFKEFNERMTPNEIVGAISTASEFEEILSGSKADAGLGKLESKLQHSEVNDFNLTAKDRALLNEAEDPIRRKTLALLWAYLHRQNLDDKTLEAEKYELAPTAVRLDEAFTSVCLAYGFTAPLLSTFLLSQCLTQAIPPTQDCLPLLQLPHFTPKIVRAIEQSASKTKSHMSISTFMSLPTEQRQAVAKAAGLTQDRLTAAESVARQLPRLQIEKQFFKVQGEKYIIPSSLVQFVVKARFIPPGTTNIPPVDEKDLLDIDPAEGDIQAQKIEPEQHQLALTYAPYLAKDKVPRYHIFLADHRQGKIAVPPFVFSTFDKKPFDDEGKPTFNVVTLKMQFQAPPQVGEYKFQMHLVCDSYVGFDAKHDISLIIDDADKALEVDDEDDISEPEEDSIAGQMAVLKGQATADPNKPKRTPKPKPEVDEESDYESGTDEDVDSESETDTDTDTDGE